MVVARLMAKLKMDANTRQGVKDTLRNGFACSYLYFCTLSSQLAVRFSSSGDGSPIYLNS